MIEASNKLSKVGRIYLSAKDKNNKQIVIKLKAGIAMPGSIARTIAYKVFLFIFIPRSSVKMQRGLSNKALQPTLLADDPHSAELSLVVGSVLTVIVNSNTYQSSIFVDP